MKSIVAALNLQIKGKIASMTNAKQMKPVKSTVQKEIERKCLCSWYIFNNPEL